MFFKFCIVICLTLIQKQIILVLFVETNVSLCLGWPQTHGDPPASASQALGLEVCATTARPKKNFELRAGELAQPGMVSGAKPEDLSSIPWTHVVEGENQIVPQLIL